MATPVNASAVNVDQSVHFVADQFEVAINDSRTFRDLARRLSIGQGFVGVPSFPTVQDGVIDEHELHVSVDQSTGQTSMTSVIRGRDLAYVLAEFPVYVTYATSNSEPAPPPPVGGPGMPPIPNIPGVTVPVFLRGPWRASDVIADLASRAGLTALYQCRDYTLIENVTCNGPILPTIEQVVAPWSQFEATKVDVWVEGRQLVLRPRPGVKGTVDPVTNRGHLALSVRDARVTELSIRARFLGEIRVFKTTGAVPIPGKGPVAVDPGDETVVSEDSLDKDEVTVSRVVTTEVRRKLDHAVKKQTVEQYALHKDSDGRPVGPLEINNRQETTSEWDDLVLAFPNRIMNSPKERSRTINVDALDEATDVLEPKSRSEIVHAYDAGGFLSAQITTTSLWDKDLKDFAHSTREVRTYRDNGARTYQVQTMQIDAGGEAQVLRSTSGGSRPGGPGRAILATAGSPTNSLGQTVYEFVIAQAGGRDFHYSNKNLQLEDMTFILEQAKRASGATEFEVSFVAAGIPYIRRGMLLTLTGLEAEDGDPIPLGEAVVTEVKTEYRENSSNPAYLSHVRACWWEGKVEAT